MTVFFPPALWICHPNAVLSLWFSIRNVLLTFLRVRCTYELFLSASCKIVFGLQYFDYTVLECKSEFILLGVCWASWAYRLFFFQICKGFLSLFLQIFLILLTLFLFSYFELPLCIYWYDNVVPQFSDALFIFFNVISSFLFIFYSFFFFLSVL